MKPGQKTTEFLVTVCVIVGQLVAAIAGNLPPQYAGIGASVVAAAYALARGFTKAGGAEAFPALAAETQPATTGDAKAQRRAELQAELAALDNAP